MYIFIHRYIYIHIHIYTYIYIVHGIYMYKYIYIYIHIYGTWILYMDFILVVLLFFRMWINTQNNWKPSCMPICVFILAAVLRAYMCLHIYIRFTNCTWFFFLYAHFSLRMWIYTQNNWKPCCVNICVYVNIYV